MAPDLDSATTSSFSYPDTDIVVATVAEVTTLTKATNAYVVSSDATFASAMFPDNDTWTTFASYNESVTCDLSNFTGREEALTGFDAFCGEVFFNVTLLLSGSWPRFSRCFLDTVVVWTACGFFWLVTSCYIIQHETSSEASRDRLPFSALNACKLFTSASLAVLSLCSLLDRVKQGEGTAAGLLADSLLLVTLLAASLVTQYERLRGFITSPSSFLFWGLKMLLDVIPLYTVIMAKVYEADVFRFVIFIAMYILVVVMVILYSFAEERPTLKLGYRSLGREPCPEVTASFLSQVTFLWLTKLLVLGYKKDLTEADMWDLNPRDRSDTLVPKFEKLWTAEVDRCMNLGKERESVLTVSYSKGIVAAALRGNRLELASEERARLISELQDR